MTNAKPCQQHKRHTHLAKQDTRKPHNYYVTEITNENTLATT